jgi:hypothetical protein
MKFDVVGRINNMRLPDGKTAILYSVYEAVSKRRSYGVAGGQEVS